MTQPAPQPKVRKTTAQYLSKHLPYVGVTMGAIAIGALLGSLPVLGTTAMNLWRLIQALIYTGFGLMFLASETSESQDVSLTVWSIVLSLAFTIGWLLYLI